MRTKQLLLLLVLFGLTSPLLAQKKEAKQFKKKLDNALSLAASGDCEGLASAGVLYRSNEEGSYGLRDDEKGMELLRKGYELNCPHAVYEFGVAVFEESNGKEFDSAIHVLARAAALGYPEADYKMGLIYLYGNGYYYMSGGGNSPEWNTKPHYNPALAGQCFKRAADKGHVLAAKELEIVKAVADKPFQRAIEAYNAGDYQTAMKYFHYAAIDKDSVAMMYLGHMYLYGLGVKANNFDPTQTFYRQAGYNGILSGFFISGQLSEKFGTNMQWAKDFYQMGADRGSVECKEAIARMNRKAAADYEAWKEKMGYKIKTDAQAMVKKDAGPTLCKMCYGSGKIVSPIQQTLYQDKNGRWYKILGTQYETCWSCKGSGKLP